MCAAISTAPALASAAGTISGTVTDAVTAAPIEGLEVCAYADPEDGNVAHCATTDANGEYTITELLVHGYRVVFEGWPLGYEHQVYREAELGYFGDAIEVGTEPVTGIDVEMAPFGRIEGTVTEAGSGAPVEGIRVCAFSLTREEFAKCAHSGSDGSYAIDQVRPGEYVVEFLGTGNLLTQAWDEKAMWAEATPLPVALSEVVPGIDAELVQGARVEGTVHLASDGQPFAGLYACAELANGTHGLCAQPNRFGEYSIEGLRTGEYVVEFKPFYETLQTQFWNEGASLSDARVLSLVDGTTTTGIDASLVEPPEAEEEDKAGEEESPPVVTTPTSTVGTGASTTSPVTTPAPAPAAPGTTPAATGRTPRSCRKGLHKESMRGKLRCVRDTKPKHRRRRRHARAARRS